MISKELLETFPTLKYVESSNIVGISYDEESKTLYVMFGNRKVYSYKEVPKETYEEFISANSLGRFIHANIKPKFNCEKVDISNVYMYVDTFSNQKVILTEIDRERKYALLDGEKIQLTLEV